VAFAAPPPATDPSLTEDITLASPVQALVPPVAALMAQNTLLPSPSGTPGVGIDPETGGVTVPSSTARVKATKVDVDFDMPVAALRAYREAAATLARTDPTCRIDWELLAGIGRVESDHGRYGGASVDDQGRTSPHILGLPLNGAPGVAAISDSDGGRLDSDPVWDRAVGPMQFIPTTWAMVAADGDGDGVRDPHDLDDAALAAGVYLCAGDRNLSTRAGAEAAVFTYNHSSSYVNLVLSIAQAYREGEVYLPSTPSPGGHGTAPTLPAPPEARNGEKPGTKAKPSKQPTSKPSSKPSAKPSDRPSGKPTKKPTPSGPGTPSSPPPSSPPPSSPPPSSPPPSSPPPSSPPPSSPPPSSPPPSPTPTPTPEETFSGSLTSGSTITVGGVVLTLDLTGVGGVDYDADGTVEAAGTEFEGVFAGSGTVSLTFRRDGSSARVASVGSVNMPAPTQSSSPTAPDPASPSESADPSSSQSPAPSSSGSNPP
jgi:hypothetical protein